MLNIIHNDAQGQGLFLGFLALVPLAAGAVIVWRVVAAIL